MTAMEIWKQRSIIQMYAISQENAITHVTKCTINLNRHLCTVWTKYSKTSADIDEKKKTPNLIP